jgi:hypothetical protein
MVLAIATQILIQEIKSLLVVVFTVPKDKNNPILANMSMTIGIIIETFA